MKLTSPNYPESYDPNTVCKWHLTTDEGYISLDLEYIYVSDKDNEMLLYSWQMHTGYYLNFINTEKFEYFLIYKFY